MAQLYVLFEHAVGYCLFKVKEFEDVGAFLPQVEAAVTDAAKFQKVVHLAGFRPFKGAAAALENMNAVSEGILTKELSAFLEANVPTPAKKGKVTLGVGDPKLGAAINEAHKLHVTHVGVVPEILRGIRFHLTSFVKGLNPASVKQSELGLGHSYSRGKVKFNVNRADNMIIQSIALVDQLDKDINTFAMRIREWYSYHFPELARIVTDNYQYAVCAYFIKNRTSLNESMLEELENITMDSAKAQAILDAGRMSMGMDISPIDLLNIEVFAKRVASLAEYRKKLSEYLRNKMNIVAPNLATLIGEVVGARLISHAGSLTNLAKCPASTVQILGAEKALFRALKTKGNTPKYGLIFHSSFIGRAGSTNKGRISRYLANKCSLASRIDCFSEVQTNVFGQKLRGQVEERLKFYESGELPRKNVDVMADAVAENTVLVKQIEKSEKKKKRKLKEMQEEDTNLNGSIGGEEVKETPTKKKKKNKNLKEATEEQEPDEMNSSQVPEVDNTSVKKKKKKKNLDQSMDASVNDSTLEDGANDVSLNHSATEVAEEGQKKKKKKKKAEKGEMEESINNSTLDESYMETGAEPKKKKKKRKSQAMEDEI